MTTTCGDDIDTGFVALGYAKVAFLGVAIMLSQITIENTECCPHETNC